ncbi:hypothetical protein [[Mycobacterium] vasticus]|uniref:Resolvase/invertase-type recombinase catalytic domain-containing protein n=1 Tax=[Mycobacterium] vasticus TaxID=2875777 RepID=A0ABU5Z4I1_9MYCO|nr:hypothetical protein [Mycolicibacter sp. MYC017]MEB3071519.1 hypothetical protein [Mycolicibacter sp. MYC017]
MSDSYPGPLILLGDQDTVDHRAHLADEAAERGCTIVDAFGFEVGEAADQSDLTKVDAVVAALARAITRRADIWVPLPCPDFIREQHLRRLSLVLQRHGVTLLLYREMWRVPTRGGTSEIDQALRAEVKSVDKLDRVALAAAGVVSLSREIEASLAKAADVETVQPPTDHGAAPEPSMPPMLPPPSVPWTQRKRLVKHYAGWLVYGCGVTQAATARVLNSAGQRTATGAQWKSASVAKLLTAGNFDVARG